MFDESCVESASLPFFQVLPDDILLLGKPNSQALCIRLEEALEKIKENRVDPQDFHKRVCIIATRWGSNDRKVAYP